MTFLKKIAIPPSLLHFFPLSHKASPSFPFFLFTSFITPTFSLLLHREGDGENPPIRVKLRKIPPMRAKDYRTMLLPLPPPPHFVILQKLRRKYPKKRYLQVRCRVLQTTPNKRSAGGNQVTTLFVRWSPRNDRDNN